MYLSRQLESMALVAIFAGLPACAIEASPAVGGYGSGSYETVPADIYGYPRVPYGGGYAYLVGNHWYYPREGGWVLLRREPPELYRYRATYGQHANPGYHGYERYVPPTQYGYPRPAPPVR